jgi:uncharacterized membrane protein
LGLLIISAIVIALLARYWVGGGLTIFYFTIAFAFHEYQLMSQQAAFAIMVIITVFAILLSLLYNKSEVAILATIGGFVTPFLSAPDREII